MFGLSFRGRHAWLRRLVVRTPPFQGGDRRFEPGRKLPVNKQVGGAKPPTFFVQGAWVRSQGHRASWCPLRLGGVLLGVLRTAVPWARKFGSQACKARAETPSAASPQVRAAEPQVAGRDPASSGCGPGSRRSQAYKLGTREPSSGGPQACKAREAANLPAETLQVRVVSPLSREPGGKADCCGSRMARPTVMARFLRPRSARFHDMRGITPGRANHGRAKRLLSCHSGRPCHSGTASARPCHSEIIAGRLPPRWPSSCSLFAGRAILRFGESR